MSGPTHSLDAVSLPRPSVWPPSGPSPLQPARRAPSKSGSDVASIEAPPEDEGPPKPLGLADVRDPIHPEVRIIIHVLFACNSSIFAGPSELSQASFTFTGFENSTDFSSWFAPKPRRHNSFRRSCSGCPGRYDRHPHSLTVDYSWHLYLHPHVGLPDKRSFCICRSQIAVKFALAVICLAAVNDSAKIVVLPALPTHCRLLGVIC